ncbi:cytoplasmic tRNA 2-thiolation protein 2 [Papilio machaon]|uniref:cytoplasmic tRNA 2-thiolation protein 2 n=1 Tax=Papilio machaon TaxID=76193 RepID=UPI001E663A60|nr:cytoplasmic tRNA 2-thiolation protein 2 [Papilio machaon]
MYCKKCKDLGTLTIRKEHLYCVKCFMISVNHKFRACIGKNKILSSNQKVLVCLTGGQSSTVLLDLIYNGLLQDNHKKLRIIPFFLHLTGFGEEETDHKVAELVINQCKSYKFNVYIVNISKFYFQKSNTLPDINSLAETNTEQDLKTNLKNILKKVTPTSSNDIETKIKHDTFRRVAKECQCNFIFTAETTTTLAVNLLSNLAIGRGSQVEYDIGFSDSRDEIKILRPMKDITVEELHHYIQIKNLTHISIDKIQDNNLQSVIKQFVWDLQENFPATVSTVCKTADKIGSIDKSDKRCQFCKSAVVPNNEKLTAIEATNFSRTVSNFHPGQYLNEETRPKELTNEHDGSMFPFINEYFCYCCSKNYLESGNQNNNLFKDMLPV